MNPVAFVRESIRKMAGYVPGWQPGPDETFIKLNTNENPYPPSHRVVDAIMAALNDDLRLYPSPDSRQLRKQAAELYGVDPAQVVCGNGSDEVLAILMRTFVDQGDTVAYFDPSYSLYPVLSEISSAREIRVDLPRVLSGVSPPDPPAKVFFLTTPNAPYGFRFPNEWIAEFLQNFQGIVVADEAYVDFARESSLSLLAEFPNLIVVRSLSKSYALAGMRVGLAVASVEIIAEMAKVRDSYNLNRLSQAAAVAALADQPHVRAQISRIIATREWLVERLRTLGFTVLPSETNFVFVVPPAKMAAADLYQHLFERGILVRYFSSPRLADGLRISIGTEDEMGIFVDTIKAAVKA